MHAMTLTGAALPPGRLIVAFLRAQPAGISPCVAVIRLPPGPDAAAAPQSAGRGLI